MSTLMSPPSLLLPRIGTPRRPERPTRGAEVALVMRDLGMPLMPHQTHAADVALELLPDGSPAFREVILLTPRQQGKTTQVMAVWLHRVLVWERQPQRVAYSAQTGRAGRDKLLLDQAPLLQASPLRERLAKVYSSMGAEAVVLDTGGRVSVVTSREASGHGQTLDLAIIDEAFAEVDGAREAALKPAMLTRADAQLWVVSTAGHEGSAYLKRKVDLGRAAVADGMDRGVCYLEWSADPEAPVDDPETWRSCMPALGHTVTLEAIRHARATSTEDEFRRAYLNQWTMAEERVIPAATWNAVCGADVQPDGDLVFGIDVAVDRSAASIVAVDGERRAELVEHREGVGWLVDRVVELTSRWAAPVAADEIGPAAPVLPELEARGVRLERYGARRMAAACARVYDALADRLVRVRQHPDLDLAAAAARKRVSGDAWYWARRDARADISPLVALTVAYDLAVDVGRESGPWLMVER